jgi:tetratricopeptide (TPR) repeat protein
MDPAADELFQKAQVATTRPSPDPDAWPDTAALLEQAIQIAPDFALAWAHLARARARMLRFGDPAQPFCDDLRAGVVGAAETALRLDPAMGVAHLALADLEAFGDFASREALVGKALAAAPDDPMVLTLVGAFAAEVGRIEDALACARRAVELDSTSFLPSYAQAKFVDCVGDGSSLPMWEALCDLWPDNEMVFAATWAAAIHGDHGLLDAFSARARQFEAEAHKVRLRAYRWLGRTMREPDADSLDRVLQIAEADLERTGSVDADWLMILYRLGLTEGTFELIERSSFAYMFDPRRRWESGGVAGSMIFNVGLNGRMIADPRFPRLCAKLGLCRYWAEADRWPDCADAVDYDFRGECRRLAAQA